MHFDQFLHGESLNVNLGPGGGSSEAEHLQSWEKGTSWQDFFFFF